MRGIYLLKDRRHLFIQLFSKLVPFVLHMNIFSLQRNIHCRRCSWLHYLSYFLQNFPRMPLFLKIISLVFYHRTQRPGRPPRGPPLVPPRGGGGASHRDRIGLLSCLDRPVLRAKASRVGIAALIRRQLTRGFEKNEYVRSWSEGTKCYPSTYPFPLETLASKIVQLNWQS